jgi:hypothetical protein
MNDALISVVNTMNLEDLRKARKQSVFGAVLPHIEIRITELSAKPKYRYKVQILDTGMLKLPRALGRESWEDLKAAVDAEFANPESKWVTYQEAHG